MLSPESLALEGRAAGGGVCVVVLDSAARQGGVSRNDSRVCVLTAPSSPQPEPESLGPVTPGFPEQEEEDELHRTLGVERFEEILQEAGSRGGEEPGRSYGEADFECEGARGGGGERGGQGCSGCQDGARMESGAWGGALGAGQLSGEPCPPAAKRPPPCRPPAVLPPHPPPAVHPPASRRQAPKGTPGPRTEAAQAPWNLPDWGDPHHRGGRGRGR